MAIDNKPFDGLVFIEKEASLAEALFRSMSEYPGRQIEIIQEDANHRVPRFCRSMGDFDRAVVFLDPYATEVSWSTVEAIAASKKIDCWILFPLMAVTRMMPTDKEPDEATASQLDRIFGGRDYWRQRYQDSAQLSFLDAGPGVSARLVANKLRIATEDVYRRCSIVSPQRDVH